MLLTRPVSSNALQVSVAHRTAVQPGDRLEIELVLTATRDATIQSLDWSATLPGMTPDTSVPPGLPTTMAAGDSATLVAAFETHPTDETFGFLEGTLVVDAPGVAPDDARVAWRSWLSVLRREVASDPDGLSVSHRGRLVDVVNSDDAVGHWMLADPWAFFDDFLNIDVPAAVRVQVGDALGLGDQGLPLDQETRHEIWIERKTFYGMVRMDLMPEEECVESDGHIDTSPAKEVDYDPELTI